MYQWIFTILHIATLKWPGSHRNRESNLSLRHKTIHLKPTELVTQLRIVCFRIRFSLTLSIEFAPCWITTGATSTERGREKPNKYFTCQMKINTEKHNGTRKSCVTAFLCIVYSFLIWSSGTHKRIFKENGKENFNSFFDAIVSPRLFMILLAAIWAFSFQYSIFRRLQWGYKKRAQSNHYSPKPRWRQHTVLSLSLSNNAKHFSFRSIFIGFNRHLAWEWPFVVSYNGRKQCLRLLCAIESCKPVSEKQTHRRIHEHSAWVIWYSQMLFLNSH